MGPMGRIGRTGRIGRIGGILITPIFPITPMGPIRPIMIEQRISRQCPPLTQFKITMFQGRRRGSQDSLAPLWTAQIHRTEK